MMCVRLMQINYVVPGERVMEIRYPVRCKAGTCETTSEMLLLRHDFLPHWRIGRVEACVPVLLYHCVVGPLVGCHRCRWP